MSWYKDYHLAKDGDGYTVIIYLNNNDTEFSQEFLTNVKENVLKLDDRVRDFVGDKFKDCKINSVKLILGSMIVASIPFIGIANAEAADTTAVEAASYTTLNTTGIVTASRLNVRSGPSIYDSIIHVLWNGNQVKVIGESGGWYKIQLSDGRTGWVSSSYLQVDSRQQKINTVINTAKSLIGTPYVWGGESLAEGGFDCSGLTQYVYSKVGYSLNRVSIDQAKQGVAVSRANIQPGDLVFYGFNGDGVINHVGIYIGNGVMIHSPKAGDYVKSTNITTSYWETRFITARRLI